MNNAVFAILQHDNKILILWDRIHKRYTFVGGGVEDEETFEQGLTREIKEESGYTDFTIGKCIQTKPHEESGTTKIYLVQLNSLDSIAISSHERENLIPYWLSTKEALEKLATNKKDYGEIELISNMENKLPTINKKTWNKFAIVNFFCSMILIFFADNASELSSMIILFAIAIILSIISIAICIQKKENGILLSLVPILIIIVYYIFIMSISFNFT